MTTNELSFVPALTLTDAEYQTAVERVEAKTVLSYHAKTEKEMLAFVPAEVIVPDSFF